MRQSDGGYFEGGGYVAGRRGGKWPDGCRRFFRPTLTVSLSSVSGRIERQDEEREREGLLLYGGPHRCGPHSEVPLCCHVNGMLGGMMTVSGFADGIIRQHFTF